MGIKVHSVDYDRVINSVVLTGETSYEFALDSIFPLINRFSAQRKIQNQSFYDRLRIDILKGCLMPPITLALINPNKNVDISVADATTYCNGSIGSGYVLDGMQRLNTLNSVRDREGFNPNGKIYLSIVISSNKDMLLYRMITLNNGQRPMTPRHQIEVLTEELFDFESLDIDVQTEKERGEKIKRGSFNLSDISKGYLAFFSDSVHNENNKIISEKMDEIIVGKIMNTAVVDNGLEFQKVLEIVDKFATDKAGKSWLMTQNNFIGFCVGVKKSYKFLESLDAADFGILATKFEDAFKGINAAKVNLGKYRRELAKKYIDDLPDFVDMDVLDLLAYFSDATAA